MPEYHPCPYLRGDVEITDERYEHVLKGHSELALYHWERLSETLGQPDMVLRSNSDDTATLFLRWYDDLDKMIVAVVISEPERNWLITGYITGDMPKGEILWERD